MKNITAHALVKNEAKFVWYSVMSVIDHVDKVLLWDTGSSDGTIKIIKEIKKRFPNKVSLKLLGSVDVNQFTDIRQQMLEETKTPWLLVVDGDEIWWKDSISNVVKEIKNNGDQLEAVVVPTKNLIGDIYHYQEERAGRYRLAGKRGQLSLRAISLNIPGLSSKNPHGTWGWIDASGKMIQERNHKKIKYIDAPYFHASFLPRAGERGEDFKVPKREKKLKYEMGISFPKDYFFPEVFFCTRPNFVPSPWVVMSNKYRAKAMLQTPIKKLRRRILPLGVGY